MVKLLLEEVLQNYLRKNNPSDTSEMSPTGNLLLDSLLSCFVVDPTVQQDILTVEIPSGEVATEKGVDYLTSFWEEEAEEDLLRQVDTRIKNALDDAVETSESMYDIQMDWDPRTRFFNLSHLNVLKESVRNPAVLLIAYDIWNDIIADDDFLPLFDPINKHEQILEGRLGKLCGMEVITDGFRKDTSRFLKAREVYILSDPQTLGTCAPTKVQMNNNTITQTFGVQITPGVNNVAKLRFVKYTEG